MGIGFRIGFTKKSVILVGKSPEISETWKSLVFLFFGGKLRVVTPFFTIMALFYILRGGGDTYGNTLFG